MDKSWDIFHLDGERGLRGGQRQLLYLAAALRARGHRNTVVCRRASPLESEARRHGFQTVSLPYLWEWDPFSAWKLARLARRARRPVLHAHTAHAAALAGLAGGLGGLPWVVHRRVDFELSGRLSRRSGFCRCSLFGCFYYQGLNRWSDGLWCHFGGFCRLLLLHRRLYGR